MIDKKGLSVTEIVKFFQYKKINKKHEDRYKFHKQRVNKTLFIAKI